jgi:L-threonylcarbamoyladenylate synthase
MTKTLILPTSDPQSIPAARAILQRHGIIAFPTDTIYGVAADAFSPAGIQKIYQAKQRPDEKALPVLIGDLAQLEALVTNISEHVRRITKAFWPGALTLILPKAANLPEDLSPYPTIGVRMPNLDFTLALLRETGPLATTSANISGGANPTTAEDVLTQLEGRVDLILDGGPTPGPTASTVVDATTTDLKILRQGPITLAQLKSAVEASE